MRSASYEASSTLPSSSYFPLAFVYQFFPGDITTSANKSQMQQLSPFPWASLMFSYISVLAFFWTSVKASLLILSPQTSGSIRTLDFVLASASTMLRLSEIKRSAGPSKTHPKAGSACLQMLQGMDEIPEKEWSLDLVKNSNQAVYHPGLTCGPYHLFAVWCWRSYHVMSLSPPSVEPGQCQSGRCVGKITWDNTRKTLYSGLPWVDAP